MIEPYDFEKEAKMKKTLWRLVLPVCLTAAAAQAQEAKLIVIGDEAQTENAVSVAGDGQVSPATAAVSQEQEKLRHRFLTMWRERRFLSNNLQAIRLKTLFRVRYPATTQRKGTRRQRRTGKIQKMKRFQGLPSNREKKRRLGQKPAPMPGRRLPNRLRERSLRQNRQQKLPRKRSL